MTNHILCGIIILLVIMHRFERKELYNRIMSKTLTEYKSKPSKHAKTAHEIALDKWRDKEGGGNE